MIRPAAIEQVDAVLAEDSRTVLFVGYTSDDHETYLASLTLPIRIDEDAFIYAEWERIAGLEWTLAT